MIAIIREGVARRRRGRQQTTAGRVRGGTMLLLVPVDSVDSVTLRLFAIGNNMRR